MNALVFQQSWLYKKIISTIKTTKVHNHLVQSNFITTNNEISPILRIIKIVCKTSNNDLVVVLGDSTHKMFARIVFDPAIIEFENEYNQRITYCTSNNLILVKSANLVMVSASELAREIDDIVDTTINYLRLDVYLIQWVQRDRVLLNSDPFLRFIYQEQKYRECCATSKEVDAEVVRLIEEDYGDVMSV